MGAAPRFPAFTASPDRNTQGIQEAAIKATGVQRDETIVAEKPKAKAPARQAQRFQPFRRK